MSGRMLRHSETEDGRLCLVLREDGRNGFYEVEAWFGNNSLGTQLFSGSTGGWYKANAYFTGFENAVRSLSGFDLKIQAVSSEGR